MYKTVVEQTEQLSRELDEKSYILCKFMDSNSFLKNYILSERLQLDSSPEPLRS